MKGFLPSMIRRISAASEIIEDSEPERQERRRHQEKQERMKALKPTSQQGIMSSENLFNTSEAYVPDDMSENSKPTSATSTVLEIVQSRSELATNSNIETDSVVDISDDDFVPSTILGPEAFSMHLQRSAHNVPKTTPAFYNHAVPTQSPITLIVSSDSETESEDDNRMALNRFAYQASSRSQSKASLSHTSSVVVDQSVADAALAQKPNHNAGQHRFMADFSDIELAKLANCVCCGIDWTTRKGAAQKMVHVQYCAKKYAFTDATVKILIRREVDKALAEIHVTKAKGKGKIVDPENLVSEEPKTYMDCIVQGVQPKRKGRRRGDLTVKNGAENVQVIRDSAKVILGDRVLPNIRDVGERQLQTQGFKPSGLVDHVERDTWTEPQPTQVFRERALRQRQGVDVIFAGAVQKRQIFDAKARDDEEASMPSSTQHFNPSKLANLYDASSGSSFNTEHNGLLKLKRPISPSSLEDEQQGRPLRRNTSLYPVSPVAVAHLCFAYE